MRVLIITRSDSGTDKEQAVEALPITVGRGSDQHVRLADLRVALKHAEIVREGKDFVLKSLALAGFTVDGLETQSVNLSPGTRVEIGLSTLQVVKRDNCDLALRIIDNAGDDQAASDLQRGKFRISLEESAVSPRRWAIGLSLVVLALFLVWPLLGGQISGVNELARSAGISPEGAWVPGGPSDAHAFFMDDCGACHTTPFVRTKDTTCGSCHNNIADHSNEGWYAAHSDVEALACNDCHREHNGAEGLIAEHARDCVSCHNGMGDFPESEIATVSSFRKHHPGFSPTVPSRDGGQLTFTDVQLPFDNEQSGLHFNHASHTDPEGINGPDGTEVLACIDCHVDDAGRVGHQPINQQDHCARCHVMTFDEGDPSAELPHAPAHIVQKTIDEHFVRRALEGAFETPDRNAPRFNPLRRRPGAKLTGTQRAEALDWAAEKAEQKAKEVFSKNVCGVCHESTVNEGRWAVQAVALQSTFLTGHRFDHGGHASMDCVDCHATDTSDSARDLLLPGIENCRDCHGDWRDDNVAPSACIDCHGFHIADVPMLTPVAQTQVAP